jgi:hypothetical protein
VLSADVETELVGPIFTGWGALDHGHSTARNQKPQLWQTNKKIEIYSNESGKYRYLKPLKCKINSLIFKIQISKGDSI